MSSAVPAIPVGGVPRVNLIPRSELERRERVATARRWGWAAVGTLAVALMLIAGALAISLLADQRLAAEQARTNTLLAELGGLADVSSALGAENDLLDFRADAAGSDFVWADVMRSLQGALPAGVEVIGFDLLAGGVPQGDDPTAEVGLVGSLTLSSPNAIDIADTVRAMRALESVAEADGELVTTSQQSVGVYTYEIVVAFDQSIYSNRFAVTEGQ